MTSTLAAPRAVLERYMAFIHKTFGDEGTSTRNLIIFVAGYYLLATLSSSVGKTGGDTDTSEIMVYTQYWDWGYGRSQPPLPAWLSKAIADVFGLSLFSLGLAKFAMLAVALAAVAVAARRLGLSAVAVAASTLGIFTIPEIGWEAQRSLAHTPGMLAFCSVGVAALIEARKSASIWTYLLFGVACAGATLCRYNGMAFFLAMVLAAVCLPAWCAVILNWRIGISLLACVLLLAPHALWALDHLAAVTQRADQFGIGVSGDFFYDRLLGLASLLKVTFNLLVVPLIVAGATLVVHPAIRRAIALPRRGDVDSLPAAVAATTLLVALIAVLVSGAVSVENRYLQPAAFLVPMAIAVAASRAGSPGNRLNLNLASFGFVCAVLAAVALPLHTIYTGQGRPHPFKLDYKRFLAELDANSGLPVGSVVTTDYRRYASLRLVRPELRVITPILPDPADHLSDPIAIVWEGPGWSAELDALLVELGISLDNLERHQTRLMRVDRPDIGITVGYAILPGRGQSSDIATKAVPSAGAE